jgi:site-specific DNA recombinase
MANLAGADAGVYTRCSMDRNDAASVTQQEEAGTARCETEGWRERRYQDNDISASRYSRKDRPGWSRLVADVRAGLLSVVWLWESSRGDRKLYEWVGFLELCRELDVRIYVETHEQLYSMRNARHMKTLAEDGIANAYRSDEDSLRIKRNAAASARKGLPNGRPAYGYRRYYHPATGRYQRQEPEPPESGIADGIITRIARNVPLVTILRELADAGVPSPQDTAWCAATLRLMARNPAYAGYRKTPDGQLIKAWPAIVSLETHRDAVRVLADPARSTQRPGRQLHLLSYLAECGACGGGVLSVVKNKVGQPRYSCRSHGCISIDPEWLDELVTLAVCDALSGPDAATLYRSDSEESARLRGEAAILRAQLGEWLKASVSPHEYQVKKAQLLPGIERAERAAVAAELPLVLRDLLAAGNVRAAWDTALDVPARRAVITALMNVRVARAADRSYAARRDPARVIIDWHRG